MNGQEWVVVHGEVAGLPDMRRINHAWLEYDGMVYNPTDDTLYESWEYRVRAQATPIAEYTFREACAMAVKFEHYGPWH